MQKAKYIFLNAVPVFLMISLIPLVANDYLLSLLYGSIIAVAFWIKHDQKDGAVFIIGFLLLAISEAIFISTGVEVFVRRTLFGLMPVWLPILWGYAFVVIKRVALCL